MNNPLGIKNNTWHIILAFLAMAAEIPLAFKYLHFPNAVLAVVAWTFFVLMLAFWNEWRQFVASDMIHKYAGIDKGGELTADMYVQAYKNFVTDTRDDIRKDLAGMFTGVIAGFLIYAVVVI